MNRMCTVVISVAAVLALVAPAWGQGGTAAPDLTKDPTLYVVGYAHLDTQWRWSYPQVIREMIPRTMRDNFRLLDLYPHYVFNFSGANRYRMMKEYYPASFDTVKRLAAAGRWFPCGSSMEECDVNVTGAESVIRQVLYGNHYFRRELGTASNEFMLPDCFGFPASLPSLLGHCGLKGFSTQKLTWGSAVGIPFHVGVWEGLDGTQLVCALDAGDYTGVVKRDLGTDSTWRARIEGNGRRSGVYADYSYYGTGDEGGAPTEGSVQWVETSVAGTGPVRVVSAAADRMFLDLPAQGLDRLPRYRGDLLLTEHSAGSITSAAAMKRWNHKNELLADAAERASVLADWLGGPPYPRERLNDAWTLVMGGQFHDILPGTSHPRAYEYSWNDELLALNQFAGVLDAAVGSIAAALDTRAKGVPLVVYNPLSIEREDVVEARVAFPAPLPRAVRVLGPDRREVPAQVVGSGPDGLRILFLARVPSVGFAVFDVQPLSAAAPPAPATLTASPSALENERYRITLDGNGDVAGIYDQKAARELLASPARLEFLYDRPRAWPAWNVDWTDRQKPPLGWVAGPARVRVTEQGPVRVAVEITREARGSRFVQTVRLAAGGAGDRVEFADRVDWQSGECSLKAAFPLAVANPEATYNWEVGTIRRGNNEPKRYEVPSHQWFDLTDARGDYGVTVLADCKYGSDKPDDRTLRLTLLRTPGVGSSFQDQATQDWGCHEILYGLAGHVGDWRAARTDWQALRLSQPLIAFRAEPHAGRLGRAFSLLRVSSDRVRVMALKQAEDGDEVIVRLVELDGAPIEGVRVSLPAPVVAAREVDGQERPLGAARIEAGSLVTDLRGYQPRTFALRLGGPPAHVPPVESRPLALTYDRSVASRDGQQATGGFDADGHALPAEMLPAELLWGGVRFALGPADGVRPNAVACAGQTIALPKGRYNRLVLLAAADGDRTAEFAVDGRRLPLALQDWGGFVGQWDARVWKGKVEDYAFSWPNEFLGLRPAFLKPAPVAWFCSHRHDAHGANEPYQYSYLFAHVIELPRGAGTLTLPRDDRVLVLAATVAAVPEGFTEPARPLLDELVRDVTPVPAIEPAGGRFGDRTMVALRRPLFAADCSMRYTLDGSDPTPAAPEYAAPFPLYRPAVVRARLFGAAGPVGGPGEARLDVEDVTPPAVTDAVAVASIPQVVASFSEPVDRTSAEDANHYAVAGGGRVTSAALAADGRTVALALSAPPTAPEPMLTVRGVRDLAPSGNQVAGASRAVTVARPLMTAAGAALDGAGGGAADTPLGTDAPIGSAAPWTINLWLRTDAKPGDYTLIGGFGNARDRSGVQRYLACFPEGLHFWASSVDIETGVPLDLGRWQMLTATFDGDTARVFKDGHEVAAASVRLADAARVARVGPPAPWSYGHQLAGRIADFSLWNRALPPQSVAALHARGLPAGAR